MIHPLGVDDLENNSLFKVSDVDLSQFLILQELLELLRNENLKLSSNHVFRGKFRVVSSNVNAKEDYEITKDELEELNAQVHQYTDKISKLGYIMREELEKICRCYVQGANVPWRRIYPDDCYTKISIPTYCFDRIRCWITPFGEEHDSSETEISTNKTESVNRMKNHKVEEECFF